MKVTKCRLEWLGHVARMDIDRMPKQMLFGWLPQTRLQGGPRRRWRDVVRCDLRAIAMSDKDWYDAPLSRTSWRETYSAGLHADEQQARPAPQEHVRCFECESLSGGKETRPGTSAQWSARNQSVSSVVLFSVQPVSAGSEARVAWQCIDATAHHSPTDLTKKPVAEEETDLVHSSNPPNL